MDLSDLPAAVQKLGSIGGSWDDTRWPDYHAMGITAEHIPALIQVIAHAGAFWEDTHSDDDPYTYTPMHAWRALAGLQAIEALPALLDILRLIEESDADLIQDELPDVFAKLGAPAVSPLTGYLLEPEHGDWARIAAAEGLKKIAIEVPETRLAVLRALASTLEGYNVEDETFNGFLVSYLLELQAVEAAPLVEQAFVAGRVDETIFGDYEDFQIGIGLLDRRMNPRRSQRLSPSFFSDGISQPEEQTPPLLQIMQAVPARRREEKKEKHKRRQARAQRKKANTKKSKKKK
jgi:hypothetical protein